MVEAVGTPATCSGTVSGNIYCKSEASEPCGPVTSNAPVLAAPTNSLDVFIVRSPIPSYESVYTRTGSSGALDGNSVNGCDEE